MLPDNIRFTQDPINDLRAFLEKKNYTKVVVLLDNHTQTKCYPLIKNALPTHETIIVPSGEEHKILATCSQIWQDMTDMHLDRHALIIVVGGGVLGDMGGFCAATYKRGIDFILMPTTLLAQVDASIGGKLGIDFNHYKNHIGVFQLPVLTMLYSGFLKTLPNEELISGFAEVVKHILTSDKKMWETIKDKSIEELNWEELILHSVTFKAKVVAEDPREKGLRKILNAGHTIGHALESYFIQIQQRVLHGYAIAVGMVSEAFIAYERGLLTIAELNEIAGFITRIFGKLRLSSKQINSIAEWALQDKKNRDNNILCVLQKGIGDATWDNAISQDEIKRGLQFYADHK